MPRCNMNPFQAKVTAANDAGRREQPSAAAYAYIPSAATAKLVSACRFIAATGGSQANSQVAG
jgi:hypothetical protein